MFLLFPAGKDRPLVCAWGFWVGLEGFTHSCSVPSNLEQEVLEEPGSKGMAGSLSHVGTESLPSAFSFPNLPLQGCDTCVMVAWMFSGLSCAGPGAGL